MLHVKLRASILLRLQNLHSQLAISAVAEALWLIIHALIDVDYQRATGL
jgi:hypothetical protein